MVWRGELCACVVAVLALFAPASAQAAVTSGHWVESSSAREAIEFWTPARMRQAQPVAITRARPGFASQLNGRSPAFGSDFERVADPTAEGFRIHGAVFFSMGLLESSRCSGTAVRSRSKSVVFTAAHCVNNGGRRSRQWFSDRWVFVPAYRYGQRPFGVFPARWLDTTRQWRATGSENYDVAAAVVGRNQRGELLGEAVGGAGIAWGLKPRQTFDVHGYPAEAPFDGETQRVCPDTPFLGHDPHAFASPGPLSLAVACGVTGGASGGGWMIDGKTLNGLTSYSYFDDDTPDFSPYFGKEVARLYGRAARVR